MIKLNNNELVNNVPGAGWGGPFVSDAEAFESQLYSVLTSRSRAEGHALWELEVGNSAAPSPPHRSTRNSACRAGPGLCFRGAKSKGTLRFISSTPVILYLEKLRPRKVKRLVQG